MQNYTLLTIGDGLVAQIPSLVLSTAAAIMVTRVSTSQDMGGQILAQLFGHPRALAVTAGVIGAIGLVPGMPNLAFLTLAGISGATAYMIAQRRQAEAMVAEPAAAQAPVPAEAKELDWDDIAPVDPIGLEVGYRLVPLVDKQQGGPLMTRIKGVRKKLSQELGFLIPPVHIRDNLSLSPSSYRIALMGSTVGAGEIHAECDLAINPGQVTGTIAGIETKDPAFGLPAIWIEPGQRDQAQTMGYTVVDASTVVATHLSQLLQTHAHELLSYEDVQRLLDKLAKTAPKLVEDLVPKTLSLGVIHKTLQTLLEEKIPIRDLRTIVETLAEHGPRSQDSGALTAVVRAALGRSIIQNISGLAPELAVITLDPSLEQLLQQALHTEAGGTAVEPSLADRMHQALKESTARQEAMGQPAVLLVPTTLRPWVARFVRHTIPGLHVLAYDELPQDKQVKVVASIGQGDV